MLFVISGPSGCGKSTLVQRVLKDLKDIQFSVSHTTRKKRDSEVEGREYYFVSKKEFEGMIEEEKLAEWAIVHGSYYGTSKREIERKGAKGDLILDIDVQGAQKIKAKFKKAIFIFVVPPLFRELKRRLEKRGEDSPDAIKKRLEGAKKEIRYYPIFDYIVINDQIDQAVRELESIILSRRCRLDSRRKDITPILQSFIEG
jgi:guanylate kinase